MSGNVVAAYPLNQIVKDLSPVQATVMKGPDGKILINRGAEAGVHVGNLWTIYKKGKPVIDPETGNEIGNLPTPVATAVVVQTEKRFSVIAVKCMAENCLITTGLSARRFHSIPVMFVDPDGRHRDLYEILSSRLPDLRWSAYMNTEVPSSAGSSGYSLVMLARDIYHLITQLKEEGITIVLVDQNIRQAIDHADYVYILELGRNKVEGPREEFADLRKALWL